MVRRLRTDLSPIIGGIEVFGQAYDPDLAALDISGRAMSETRLRSGFGAPPVVPYAQRLVSGTILSKILPKLFTQRAALPVLTKTRAILSQTRANLLK